MIIDKNICISCCICLDWCPVNAIKQQLNNSNYNSIIFIDQNECINCLNCLDCDCPVKAIKENI